MDTRGKPHDDVNVNRFQIGCIIGFVFCSHLLWILPLVRDKFDGLWLMVVLTMLFCVISVFVIESFENDKEKETANDSTRNREAA